MNAWMMNALTVLVFNTVAIGLIMFTIKKWRDDAGEDIRVLRQDLNHMRRDMTENIHGVKIQLTLFETHSKMIDRLLGETDDLKTFKAKSEDKIAAAFKILDKLGAPKRTSD